MQKNAEDKRMEQGADLKPTNGKMWTVKRN